jgi:FkbM family methyltransferase
MNTALSTGDLKKALAKLGRDPERRKRIIALLLELEPTLTQDGLNVREEVTGPVVDALHDEGELIQKTLRSGVKLSFPYRSKIARDFVMAAQESPEHAWEPQTTKLLLSLGEDARTAIIGGAYFGDQAIPLAHQIAKKGGICHCFDINLEQIAVLQKNSELNGLKNVVVNRLGLWDKDDHRLVLVGDDSHAFAREASQAEQSSAFPTTTIDSYAASQGLDRVDIIMLDIEGAELPALRGARKLLSQPQATAPIVIFEVHRSYVDWSNGLEKTDIARFLSELGYHLFAIRDYQSNVDMTGKPVELVPVEQVYLEGPPHGFNMLALKDQSLVRKKSLKITPGVSPKLLFHRDPRLHQPLS